MHTQIGRELTYDQQHTLVISVFTNYDSKFNSMSTKTSRRIYHTGIGDNNFNQDSLSEGSEDFDYNIDTSATKLLANVNIRELPNSNSYLIL